MDHASASSGASATALSAAASAFCVSRCASSAVFARFDAYDDASASPAHAGAYPGSSASAFSYASTARRKPSPEPRFRICRAIRNWLYASGVVLRAGGGLLARPGNSFTRSACTTAAEIMAHDSPLDPPGLCASGPPGCTDPDVLGATPAGAIDPSIQFVIPPSGVFNVQWTHDARDDFNAATPAAKPVMSAGVVGAGIVRFPSDELDVFPARNREMTTFGNIFGSQNMDPSMLSCQSRLVPTGEGAFTATLCAFSNQETCTPCTRAAPGALKVLFPHAHLWLSRHWNSAQDYYQARACSSNLATCIASFEGFIDALYFNPAFNHLIPPCIAQSFDRDAQRPLPYAGAPRRLHDANFCFVDRTAQAFFAATTFFPNYRDLGACGAVGPAATPTCAYSRAGEGEGDGDGDDD